MVLELAVPAFAAVSSLEAFSIIEVLSAPSTSKIEDSGVISALAAFMLSLSESVIRPV